MEHAWLDVRERADEFFAVLHTTARSQVATMRIEPGEEAGAPETHDTMDQVILVLEGEMLAKVWDEAGKEHEVRGGAGRILVVPAGRRHWVKSVGERALLFFTVYAPPAY